MSSDAEDGHIDVDTSLFSKKPFAILVIGSMMILQSICFVAMTEWFPFSPFPMYKGKETGENRSFYFTYYLDKEGRRYPLQKYTFVAPVDYYLRHRLFDLPLEGPLEQKHHKLILGSMEHFVEAHHKQKAGHPKIFEKLIFIRKYFRSFSEEAWNQPDMEVKYFEKDLVNDYRSI